jgi:O-6-methylguanine DNA methyltransferase
MSMKEAREMVEGLRATRVTAPPDLTGSVLSAVGLVDAWTQLDGPIGPLFVAWGEEGITAVERDTDPPEFETEYAARTSRPVRRVPEMPAHLRADVEKRLAGRRTSGPPIDLGGLTEFEQSVLRKTMEIPYGEVRPYSWVAREIGRPRAVRAVGTALSHNPITFVIPCHRVVRADGRIGEYGAGGPAAKRAVLGTEGIDADELERLASHGVRYAGSDTNDVYCYPSCRHARRITPAHRVEFGTAEEATAAGYRPCRDCRPPVTAVFAA